MTGYRGGAVSVTYRKGLNQISGAPTTSTLLAHQSFFQDKIGAGIVFMNENVNVLQTFQANIPLAYHLTTTKNTSVSFGIRTGVQQKKINFSKVNATTTDEVLLNYGNKTNLNFDFSTQLNHTYYQIGFTLKNLIKNPDQQTLSKLVFANLYIPIKDEFDLIEPTIMVYHDKNGKWNMMSYIYYTFLERFIVGGGYKTGNQYLASLGISVHNRFIIGYNYEYNASKYKTTLGDSHEISLRVNFNQRYYNQRKYSIFSKPIQGMDSNKQ